MEMLLNSPTYVQDTTYVGHIPCVSFMAGYACNE